MNQDTALIKSEPALPNTYDDPKVIAESCLKSGFYKDVKTIEQALTKLMYGKALGFSPAFAMQKLLVVNDQVTMMGEAILVKWKDEGIRWYRFFYNKNGENIGKPETADKKLFGCGIVLWDKNGQLLTVGLDGKTAEPATFDLDRANQAQLLYKDNWKKYPDRMVFYRALAFAARDYTPGLTQGLLTTEEAQDIAYVKVMDVKAPDGPVGGGSAPLSQGAGGDGGICPIHQVPFTLNKWNAYTHPTDEKKVNPKTGKESQVWCYKDKVGAPPPVANDPVVETEDSPPEKGESFVETVTVDIGLIDKNWADASRTDFFAELDRIILDQQMPMARVKEIMLNDFGYNKRTEITLAKRNQVLQALREG